MKIKLVILINLITIISAHAQQQEISFLYHTINFSAAPRTTISPMSMKLWDNYGNGGPSGYGTVLEIYGLQNHQTSQLYFGGWDNSKIKYREAFYAQNTWSDWITLLDSKNNVESAGLMLINGQGDHYIANGNVGIGTTTPKEKLSVNGKIRAHEIKVETANWPDYVFEEGYQIGTLAALESYIKTHKHLPEVPSAKDVAANGVELGEMNKVLLKKIEELTLHLIEKDKQLLEQTKKNKNYEDRLHKLEQLLINNK